MRGAREGLVPRSAQLYTAGGPRVGNEAFRQSALASLPNTWRVVNQRDSTLGSSDPVPGIPTKWMGYRHAGNLVRIDAEKAVLTSAIGAAARSLPPTPAEEGVRGFHGSPDPDAADPRMEDLRGAALQAYYDKLFDPGARWPSGVAPAEAAQERSLNPVTWTGVDLHSLGGYLDNLGREAMRHLRQRHENRGNTELRLHPASGSTTSNSGP